MGRVSLVGPSEALPVIQTRQTPQNFTVKAVRWVLLTNSQFGQHSWGQLKDGQSHRGHLEPGPGAEGEQPWRTLHVTFPHSLSAQERLDHLRERALPFIQRLERGCSHQLYPQRPCAGDSAGSEQQMCSLHEAGH